jgi:hypothetical protein
MRRFALRLAIVFGGAAGMLFAMASLASAHQVDNEGWLYTSGADCVGGFSQIQESSGAAPVTNGEVRSRQRLHSPWWNGGDCDDTYFRPPGYLAGRLQLWAWTQNDGGYWFLCRDTDWRFNQETYSDLTFSQTWSWGPCGSAYYATMAGLYERNNGEWHGDWLYSGYHWFSGHYAAYGASSTASVSSIGIVAGAENAVLGVASDPIGFLTGVPGALGDFANSLIGNVYYNLDSAIYTANYILGDPIGYVNGVVSYISEEVLSKVGSALNFINWILGNPTGYANDNVNSAYNSGTNLANGGIAEASTLVPPLVGADGNLLVPPPDPTILLDVNRSPNVDIGNVFYVHSSKGVNMSSQDPTGPTPGVGVNPIACAGTSVDVLIPGNDGKMTCADTGTTSASVATGDLPQLSTSQGPCLLYQGGTCVLFAPSGAKVTAGGSSNPTASVNVAGVVQEYPDIPPGTCVGTC